MTTLVNRQAAALVIIDVQQGVFERAHRRDAVIANIVFLLSRAHLDLIPVVWVQHSGEQLTKGSDAWQIVPELAPGKNEPLVYKNYADAFEDTDLEAVLSGLSVGKLFVAGAETDECIRATIHGAFVRGYDVTLVRDAHTTNDKSAWGAPPPEQVIAHTNLYWTYQTAPGRTAGTIGTRDVAFRAPAGADKHARSPLN